MEIQEKKKLPKMLNVMDIKQHLNISKETAYKLVKLKDFPKIIIGNRYYIPEDKYVEWLNKRLKTTIIL